MRLTIIIITISLMQVSASGLAQKVNLSLNNASIEQVLLAVKQQTGYKFLYTTATLAKAKPVSINVKNEELTEVLKICFADQPLVYTVEEKTVIVKEKPASLVDKVAAGVEAFFRQDSLVFKGRVLDPFGQPMGGASVKVKGSEKSTFTTKEGSFAIFAEANSTLQISYVGYETQELKLRREDARLIRTFNMKPVTQDLGEVAIVSTGYQDLPKERATGSFEVITAKQLQHSTDPNLLKRLEGITTSMDFNNPQTPTLSSNGTIRPPITYLTIRGKNTLNLAAASVNANQASGQVLVVIDGIASPYSIDKINPNDVESMTVLKDAAAASIWGSRASNGVIVVKTKKGNFDRPTTVSFNSNLNITDKVDLFYKKYMSSSDFVDFQIAKYQRDFADGPLPNPEPSLTDPQPSLSPVAEIMNDLALGELQPDQAKAKLAVLRGNDVRNDFNKYILRKQVIQSYYLSIDGGSNKYAYYLSGGYDHTQNNTISSGANRYNLSYNTTIKPVKNLQLSAIVNYNQTDTEDQSDINKVTGLPGGFFYPYTRLVDDQGNPAVVTRAFRQKYLDLFASTYGSKVLDMSYKPLDDINESYLNTKNQGLNLNLSANYKLNPIFSGNLTYSYNWVLNEKSDLRGSNSYYARDLINKFTLPPNNPDVPNPFTRNVPLGGIYIPTLTKSNNQTLRGQINADKTWNDKHQLSAIAGVDVGQSYFITRTQQFFGYNEETLATNSNIQFGKELYTLYNDIATGFNSDRITTSNSITDYKLRTYSFYSNAAYTFDKRYTLSGSIRKDVSSIFGQSTNRKGTPYFSMGASWSINNEKFYQLDWLPYLQLRTTFGYNGNVNASVFPIPTIVHNPAPTSGASLLPYANTTKGNNPLLRPEKSGILNLGLDFGIKNSRLTGSIEYYIRKTTDLIANGAMDPSTGFNQLDYNAADLRAWGTDLRLNSLNMETGLFRWDSNFLFSHNRVKVTRLFSPRANTAAQVISGSPSYSEGAELSRLFAYRWAGLDPETGDPMGYIDDKAVRVAGAGTNLTAINLASASTARYFGSSVPVYYGSLRNTFTYGKLAVSVNVLYKLGYYFRKSNTDIVRYSLLFNNNILQGAEYANRWQNPGDETKTHVPSLTFPLDESRDLFYQFSEVNVLKADHIRLQEINLSYTFNKGKWIFKNPRIYANVNNLGLIWTANKEGIDPDIQDLPQPRTYSFGLSASF